jgi:actin-related protein 2
MSYPDIILDQGTSSLKAGLSNNEKPLCKIPFVIGRPTDQGINVNEFYKIKPLMIGDEVISIKSPLELSNPIKKDNISNMDDAAILWDYVISKKLGIDNSNLKSRKLLITDGAFSTYENKNRIAEILFEKIGIGFLGIEPKALLSIYAYGSETGVIVDSRNNNTQINPICSSYILLKNIKQLNIGGKDITKGLGRLIITKGYPFHLAADLEKVNKIKEKYCFVSSNLDTDRKLEQETTYYNSNIKLPDGRNIIISKEKFEAPEILFNPLLILNNSPGMHELLFNSIEETYTDIRKDLYSKIILSGGNTLIPGLPSRLELELKKLYKEKYMKSEKMKSINTGIKIYDIFNRQDLSFIGATIVSECFKDRNSNNYWISKEDWEENGSIIIY